MSLTRKLRDAGVLPKIAQYLEVIYSDVSAVHGEPVKLMLYIGDDDGPQVIVGGEDIHPDDVALAAKRMTMPHDIFAYGDADTGC